MCFSLRAGATFCSVTNFLSFMEKNCQTAKHIDAKTFILHFPKELEQALGDLWCKMGAALLLITFNCEYSACITDSLALLEMYHLNDACKVITAHQLT